MFSDFWPYFVSAGFLRAHLLDHAFGPYFVSAGFRIPALGRQTTKHKNHFFDTTVVKCLLQEGQLLAARQALAL